MSVIAICALLALTPSVQGGLLFTLQRVADGPSPATGHAQVIAQGVAPMPADEVAWRVVRDTAEPLDEAEPRERAVGFTLAVEDAMVVNDVGVGTQTRLAAGEAAFVPEGAQQERASLSGVAIPYYRIALVPAAQVEETDDDELIFAGETFPAPGEDVGFDLDLVRDVLSGGQSTTIDAGETPALILATDGEISISNGSGEGESLAGGDGFVASGALTIQNTGTDDATFVAAVIGAAVPPLEDGSADLTLAVWACPESLNAEGVRAAVLEAAAETLTSCAALTGEFETTVTAPDDDELVLEEAETLENGVYRWNDLALGAYVLNEPSTLPAFYSEVLSFADGLELENGAISLTSEVTSGRIDLYLLRTGAGVVTLQGRACPEGMTAATLEVDLCALSDVGLAVRLLGGENGGDVRTTAEAEFDGRTYRWNDVAVAPDGEFSPEDFYTYVVRVDELPDGVDDAVLDGPDPDGDPGDEVFHLRLTAAEPRADLTLYLFQSTGGESDGDGGGDGDATGVGGETTGSIALLGHPCPAADSPTEFCAGTTIALAGATLRADDTGETWTLADAQRDGDAYTWTNLPTDTYYLVSSDLVPPAGYAIVRIIGGAGDVADGYAISVNPTRPDVLVEVLLVPLSDGSNGGGSETPPDGGTAPDPGIDPSGPESPGDGTPGA